VDTVYVVDSNGALYSEQIHDLVLGFLAALDGTGKHVGIHAHNNMQLAYANTVEALIVGADRLDATIAGLGRVPATARSSCCCRSSEPQVPPAPGHRVHRKTFRAPGKEPGLGLQHPYLITGMLNEHPRAAIAVRESEHKASIWLSTIRWSKRIS